MKHSINKDPVVSFLEFYAHRKLEPQNILALNCELSENLNLLESFIIGPVIEKVLLVLQKN